MILNLVNKNRNVVLKLVKKNIFFIFWFFFTFFFVYNLLFPLFLPLLIDEMIVQNVIRNEFACFLRLHNAWVFVIWYNIIKKMCISMCRIHIRQKVASGLLMDDKIVHSTLSSPLKELVEMVEWSWWVIDFSCFLNIYFKTT